MEEEEDEDTHADLSEKLAHAIDRCPAPVQWWSEVGDGSVSGNTVLDLGVEDEGSAQNAFMSAERSDPSSTEAAPASDSTEPMPMPVPAFGLSSIDAAVEMD